MNEKEANSIQNELEKNHISEYKELFVHSNKKIIAIFLPFMTLAIGFSSAYFEGAYGTSLVKFFLSGNTLLFNYFADTP